MEEDRPMTDLVRRIKARRTTIISSIVEKNAFRRLLYFLSDEQFSRVNVTDEELSILARFSWQIIPPPPDTNLPPKENILIALESPAKRSSVYEDSGHLMKTDFATFNKALVSLNQA